MRILNGNEEEIGESSKNGVGLHGKFRRGLVSHSYECASTKQLTGAPLFRAYVECLEAPFGLALKHKIRCLEAFAIWVLPSSQTRLIVPYLSYRCRTCHAMLHTPPETPNVCCIIPKTTDLSQIQRLCSDNISSNLLQRFFELLLKVVAPHNLRSLCHLP